GTGQHARSRPHQGRARPAGRLPQPQFPPAGRAAGSGAQHEAEGTAQMSKLKRKQYQALLEPMQVELAHAARWLQQAGKRLVVVVEGRDTAGKGGAIDAIREYLNPRQCRVVALPKPTEREATQWYFQRYAAQLP